MIRTFLAITLSWSLGGPVLGQEAATPPATSRLRLTFVGDIMGHGGQIAAAQLEPGYYDYSPGFRFVAPLLQQADLAVGNLELTLPGGPPYTGYPMFRSPDELALALRNAGFNLLVTANNHSNDGGLIGVQNTIKTLREYGFWQTGTFLDSLHRDARYPLIVYKGPFKLVFLNYTYGTNGLPNRKPTIVNLIDEKQMEADMAVARSLEPDAIFVVIHWGDEYQLRENQTQRDLTDKLFRWGADVIIGAHPHVVQPLEERTVVRPDSSREQVLVAYSLGNFVSSQNKKYTDMGLMVEVELEKDWTTQRTRIAGHNYIPIFRYIHKDMNGRTVYYALPAAAFTDASNNDPLPIPASTRASMIATLKAVRDHLGKFGSSERKVSIAELIPGTFTTGNE